MEAGLQIFNEEGVLQLDTNSPVLCLRHKYVLTKATYPGNPSYSFTFAAHRPVVAFYAASPSSLPNSGPRATIDSFYLKDNGNGTWTCAFQSSSPYFGIDIEVYIFDLASAMPASANNYGLQVFDADGKLIYNSDFLPLRMVYFSRPGEATPNNPYRGPGGVNGWASANDLHPEWTVTPPPHAAGIKCAVVYTSTRYGYQDDGGDIEGIVEILSFKGDQTNLSYNYNGTSENTGGGVGTYLYFIYPPYLWFIDVTGY